MANNPFPHNSQGRAGKGWRAGIAGIVAGLAVAAGWHWIPASQDSVDWSIAMDAAPMAQRAVENCMASLDCVSGGPSMAPLIDLRLMGDDALYCSPEPCEINARTRVGVASDGIVIVQHDEQGKKMERAFAPRIEEGRVVWRRLPDGIVTMSFAKAKPIEANPRVEEPAQSPVADAAGSVR